MAGGDRNRTERLISAVSTVDGVTFSSNFSTLPEGLWAACQVTIEEQNKVMIFGGQLPDGKSHSKKAYELDLK